MSKYLKKDDANDNSMSVGSGGAPGSAAVFTVAI